MPVYEVKFRESPNGPVRQQLVEAEAEAVVLNTLEGRNYSVLSIINRQKKSLRHRLAQVVRGNVNLSFRWGVTSAELALLCEVMKSLYASGLDLPQILEMTAAETPNGWLRKRLVRVRQLFNEGSDVYTAMSDPRCRKAFPVLMRETIRTGLANGRLDNSLARLAEIYRRNSETKRQTITAMIYPGIALLVFLAVCTVLAIIIPTAMEEAIGPDGLQTALPLLPPQIRLLFFLKAHKIFLLAPPAAIVGLAVLWSLGKRHRATRIALTRVERKVPLIGKLLYKFALVRFLDLMAANNETGIEVPESLRLIRGSVGDALMEESVERMRTNILTTGLNLADAMNAPQEHSVYPGLVRQMVRAGMSSGKLTESLLPIMEYYELEAEAALKRTLDAMTPVMIILLGAVIGPIVYGVYQSINILGEQIATGV